MNAPVRTVRRILDAMDRAHFYSVIAPPAKPRDLLTFAQSLRLPPGSRYAGQFFRVDSHPAQKAWLRALASGRFTDYVAVACTQDGKSWVAAQIPLLWATCELRQPVAYGMPDMRGVSDAWLEKIRPAFEATAETARHLPRQGSGSGGGSNVTTIILHDAAPVFFLGGGGANKAGQASRTTRWVIVDEFGKIKPSLATKFDRRADSFDTLARRIKAGTVELDRGDRLLAAYDSGTRCRMRYRCHRCGKYTALEWEQVTYDNTSDRTARASARVHCARCGNAWTDEERKANLPSGADVPEGMDVDDAGNLVGDYPETETYSLRWGALDSPLKSLGTLCVWHRRATIKDEGGDSTDLVDFWHDQLARPFPLSEEEENVDAEALAKRSADSTYVAGEVPTEARFLVAAIDQSLRRYWWQVQAWDDDGRAWIVAWGFEPICGEGEQPTSAQRMAKLHEVLAKLRSGFVKPATAEMLKPAAIAIDVGDWTADTVHAMRHEADVVFVRGTGDAQVRRMGRTGTAVEGERTPGWYEVREQERDHGGAWRLVFVDSDAVKRQLVRRLQRPHGQPGATMLPASLGPLDDLVVHLVAERWEQTDAGAWRWVKYGRRNDFWDTAYYCTALVRYLADLRPAAIRPNAIGEAQSVPPSPYERSTRGEWIDPDLTRGWGDV